MFDILDLSPHSRPFTSNQYWRKHTQNNPDNSINQEFPKPKKGKKKSHKHRRYKSPHQKRRSSSSSDSSTSSSSSNSPFPKRRRLEKRSHKKHKLIVHPMTDLCLGLTSKMTCHLTLNKWTVCSKWWRSFKIWNKIYTMHQLEVRWKWWELGELLTQHHVQ